MAEPLSHSLATHPIHLGLGATAEPQPPFPPGAGAMDWYEATAAAPKPMA